MNITRLAGQLKVTPQELRSTLPKIGFDIGSRAHKVNDSKVDIIIKRFNQYRKQEALKESEGQIIEIRDKKKAGEQQKDKTVALPGSIIVKDLAERLDLPVNKVMGEMMKNGIMASLNEALDFETATIIAEDLGYKVSKDDITEEVNVISQKERLRHLLTDRKSGGMRPPVVVVMGHVDHGKTKLLDTIRETNIIGGESGGITQHIGAYQTEVASKEGTRTITFLDTPGHEAFKAMRSRGGQIADVAILVVAADDGLKPQTLESIAVIQKENLPFIIAINKIDKEEADIERVKKELAEINLSPEDWGGTTTCIPISAKQNTGITDLLEMILLVIDMAELKADTEGSAVGTIIESHMDKHEGPVATALIQAGTLRCNDLLAVSDVPGKVKALKNWKGQDIKEAVPGMPVKILGLKSVPAIGEILTVETDKKLYNKKIKNQKRQLSRKPRINTVKDADDEKKSIPTLNLIIKADVLGSLEALTESIAKMNTEKAKISLVKKGLGQLTEADILTAQATDAMVISFHLPKNKQIAVLAQEKEVILLSEDVIYHLIERLDKALLAIQEKEIVRELIGKLEVLAIFKATEKKVVCGGKIIDGIIKYPSKVKVLRGHEVITYGKLINLQMGKEDVKEAVAPNEVGLAIEVAPLIKENDILEFFLEK